MASDLTIISEYKDDLIHFNHAKYTNPIENDFEVHTHDVCELIFLISGNVSGIIDAKTYKLGKNCLILFRTHIPHQVKINDNTNYERYDILFDQNLLANKIFCKIPKELEITNCSGNNYIIDLFKKLDYYCKNFEGVNLKKVITNVVEELLFNLYLIPYDNFNKNLIATNPIINKAIEFINAHFTEDITVDDISKHVYVTKSHLHHLFIENLQISPKKLINIKRLSKAQHLIRMGEKPGDIYLSCGFNDYVTFFRNYSSYLGHNPSQENDVSTERNIKS